MADSSVSEPSSVSGPGILGTPRTAQADARPGLSRATETTVSVVIPAKDDARRLATCLAALRRQGIPPQEIIVVDNGSSDSTAAVATSGGARLVRESRSGIPAASATGYDAATGDVIARLDADSIPAPDWIETIARLFTARPDVDCITGSVAFSGGPRVLRRIGAALYLGAYYVTLIPALGHVPMFGSNCAMRRTVWNSVRWTVHRGDAELHDDLDLSFHLPPTTRTRYVGALRAQISHRPLTDAAALVRRFRRGVRTVVVHWPADLPWRRWASRLAARAGAAAVLRGVVRLRHDDSQWRRRSSVIGLTGESGSRPRP